MNSLRIPLATAAVAMLAAACVGTPRHAAVPLPWPERRAMLQADDDFTLSGRVALSAPGTGFNASLRWRQQGGTSLVSLDGPLGVGGAEVEVVGLAGVDLRWHPALQPARPGRRAPPRSVGRRLR